MRLIIPPTDYLDEFKESEMIATNDEVIARIPMANLKAEEWFGLVDYSSFSDHFLRAVVGNRKFDQDKRSCLLSNLVTVSDEAFAILVCENNIEKWIDMHKRNDRKQSNVVPKYTNGGKSNNSNGTSKRNKGWSMLGTKRYVELYQVVTMWRKQNERRIFEEEYLKKKKIFKQIKD